MPGASANWNVAGNELFQPDVSFWWSRHGGVFVQKRMADLPREERPYEKCLSNGPSSLSDAELLAVIIRTGARGEGSLELARKVLELSPMGDGILGIYHASLEELMSIKGVGLVKAMQLKCVAELAKRIRQATARERLSFLQPGQIADFYMEELRHEEQEKIILLMLNTKSQLIGEKVLSVGTVNASLISPREIFMEALRHGAVNIILLHNHPSGDSTPSRDDVRFTDRIRQCGELMGIHLLDHIVIGDNNYTSFMEDSRLGNPEGDEKIGH